MKNNQSFYAVIPYFILTDKKLSPTAKLVYGEISALANKEGYCFASNAHIAEIFNISARTVSRIITKLKKRRHILIKNGKTGLPNRKIYLLLRIPTTKMSEPTTKMSITHDKNVVRRLIDRNINRDIYSNIYMSYKKKICKNAKLTKKAKVKIQARLKEYSVEELIRAMDVFASNSWWMKHNSNRGIAWWFNSEDRIEQFLKLKSDKKTITII